MLRRFLPSVIQHSAESADIVVADNASTDDSVEVLKTEFPGVRIISLDKNYGFAEGYNRALQQVESDFYLLLNSDVEVTDGWLTPLLDFMVSHPECASPNYLPKLLVTPSSMPVLAVVTSTVTVILSAVVACLRRWRRTTDSMTMWRKCCGLRVRVC